VQQVIRPTGVVDPELCRPTDGQIDDLLGEIKDRVDRRERVLVTTLTKRMAEDLQSICKIREFGCVICTRKLIHSAN